MNFFEIFLACLLANIAVTVATYFGLSLYWHYVMHQAERTNWEDDNA